MDKPEQVGMSSERLELHRLDVARTHLNAMLPFSPGRAAKVGCDARSAADRPPVGRRRRALHLGQAGKRCSCGQGVLCVKPERIVSPVVGRVAIPAVLPQP
jgi:hypothetical protein